MYSWQVENTQMMWWNATYCRLICLACKVQMCNALILLRTYYITNDTHVWCWSSAYSTRTENVLNCSSNNNNNVVPLTWVSRSQKSTCDYNYRTISIRRSHIVIVLQCKECTTNRVCAVVWVREDAREDPLNLLPESTVSNIPFLCDYMGERVLCGNICVYVWKWLFWTKRTWCDHCVPYKQNPKDAWM